MVLLLGGLVLAAGCKTSGHLDHSKPPMTSRQEWRAAEPLAGMKPQQPERITIHHTATLQNPEQSLADKLKALQQFSQSESQLASGKTKPAWPDVPYHYYIDVHGAVGEGRDVHFAGDTNTEYDPTGHILIVLEGNFEEESPTESQMATLRSLTAWLSATYSVPSDRIGGHKDFASTACPGTNLESQLPELRAFIAKIQ